MHVVVSTLQISPWFGRVVDGTPVVAFRRGSWHQGGMRSLRMLESDVMAAVRQKGLMHLDQLRYATVGRRGKVSGIPEGDS